MDKLNRRELLAAGAALLPGRAAGETKPAMAAADVLTPARLGTVRIGGWLGTKLNLCLSNRVMAQNIERLIEPFRARQEKDVGGFRCEYWGKWFTSAALGYSYEPTAAHREVIDRAARSLIATRSSNGYIGTYAPQYQLDGWDIWGRKYVLLGLLAWHEVTGNQNGLDAARGVADHFRSQVGPGKVNIAETGYPGWMGLPSTSILEPVALLYQRTGEKRYLNLAEYIVAQWSVPNKLAPRGLRLIEDVAAGVPPIRIGAPKAYEMMSNFEGLCELYRATGDRKYLDTVLKFGQSIRRTERMVNGSASNHELWCEGVRYQTEILEQPMETCVTATWMKVCYQLLRLSGDPVWADELELSLYNALLGAMMPDGGWWSYFGPLVGERVPSPPQHPDVGLSCCVANGPRGLLMTPRWAVMSAAEGPVVNLYAAGSAKVPLAGGGEAEIVQETGYPVDGHVKLTIRPSHTERFTLRLRIPAWSRNSGLAVNGQAVTCQPGTYAAIRREWATGDTVTLALDMRGRAVAAPSGAPAYAVMRGPVLLALDSRLEAPRDTALRLKPAPDGTVELVSKPSQAWMAFEVPFEWQPAHVIRKQTSLTMCDFMSAGNQFSASNRYRVWLPQPVALRDAYPEDTWRLMYPDDKTRPQKPGA